MSFLEKKVSLELHIIFSISMKCTLKSLNLLYQKSTIMATEVKHMHIHMCVWISVDFNCENIKT